MKLLFVVGSLKHFISHYFALAKAAQNKGYSVHVAGPLSEEAKLLAAENFTYHAITR